MSRAGRSTDQARGPASPDAIATSDPATEPFATASPRDGSGKRAGAACRPERRSEDRRKFDASWARPAEAPGRSPRSVDAWLDAHRARRRRRRIARAPRVAVRPSWSGHPLRGKPLVPAARSQIQEAAPKPGAHLERVASLSAGSSAAETRGRERPGLDRLWRSTGSSTSGIGPSAGSGDSWRNDGQRNRVIRTGKLPWKSHVRR